MTDGPKLGISITADPATVEQREFAVPEQSGRSHWNSRERAVRFWEGEANPW
ncbi:hypothetical protein SS05631_c23390 [Sinorhizobium sp. CCBAU 05631]|nr:hypothetical protein SS05631_c23390 [Sinorhizobium sp. CCBAU 05631]